MFIEDDIIFSSKFRNAVENSIRSPDYGFETFYQPNAGYGRIIMPIDKFMGTQCLNFPVSSVELLIKNRHQMNHIRGYDIKWSRFLASKGLTLYSSEPSTVQHIGNQSRMGNAGHQSSTFTE
jgi:hypothetical protein